MIYNHLSVNSRINFIRDSVERVRKSANHNQLDVVKRYSALAEREIKSLKQQNKIK
jgi:hypothetical protein